MLTVRRVEGNEGQLYALGEPGRLSYADSKDQLWKKKKFKTNSFGGEVDK